MEAPAPAPAPPFPLFSRLGGGGGGDRVACREGGFRSTTSATKGIDIDGDDEGGRGEE